MRSATDHVAQALALVEPLGVERVPLASALGRALAEPVRAAADAPPFRTTSMDGYAVRSNEGAPGLWEVSADVPAGIAPAPLAAGTVARVMTGAPMPDGADAVVPVEDTDRGVDRVEIHRWPAPGAFVREAGEDLHRGDEVLGGARLLRAVDLAASAAAGAPDVSVVRRPRVGVLITGDEVRPPGSALEPGQIFDASSTTLPALVEEWGGECVGVRVVGDTDQAVVDALDSLEADLLITAGGVSAGAYDVVKSALVPHGVWFGPVAMQPGKPQGLGLWRGVPIVCMPGNPVSVVATFLVVVAPMMREMLRLPSPAVGTAVAGVGWRCPPGRAQLMPVRFEGDRVVPATAGGSGSHLIGSLAQAEAFAVVAADVSEVLPGDTVGLMGITP